MARGTSLWPLKEMASVGRGDSPRPCTWRLGPPGQRCCRVPGLDQAEAWATANARADRRARSVVFMAASCGGLMGARNVRDSQAGVKATGS